jgi:arabinosyltransferase B/arabinosyltransferase C
MLSSSLRVTGLFTQLDLRERPGLRVSVLPYPQDTRPSGLQTWARIIAVLLLAAAAAALAVPRRIDRPRLPTLRPPSIQDVVVVLTLATYWLIAPLQDDDGWVRARQSNSLVSGGFSSYYQHWGADMPFITWFEWLQHFVIAYTGSLALHRLPMIVLLLGAWLLCRVSLRQLLERDPTPRDGAWWSAALTFAVGAAAYGVTLRPEPALVVISVAVLACCLRYAAAPGVHLLVTSVLLAALAVTIHPAGVVAVTPLVVCVPQVIRDARRAVIHPLAPFVVILMGTAATLVLAFLDADLSSRKDSVSALSTDPSEANGILQEFDRYRRLSGLNGTPLRRELVVLLYLAIAALLVRRIRRSSLAEKLPSASIALALATLSLTPSKWIWHFGTLIAMCAVAIGLEVDRLAGRQSSLAKWGTALIVLITGLWAARGSYPWTTYDTGTIVWADVPYLRIMVVVAGSTLIGLVLLGRRRPLRPDVAALLVVLVSILGTTTVALAYDAGQTNGWTATRQALSSVIGDGTCGLASGTEIAAANSLRRLTPVAAGRRSTHETDDRLFPETTPRFNTSTTGKWFHVPKGRLGALVSGAWDVGDQLVVSWGRVHGTSVHVQSSGVVDPEELGIGFAPAGSVLVTDFSFPVRPAGADAVRIHVAPGRDTGSRSRVTDPVTFTTVPLSAVMARRGVRTLVTPYLFEAVPCATLPGLRYGVANPPRLMIEGDLYGPLSVGTSPFVGISDVFEVLRVPLENWDRRRGDVFVYWVLRRAGNAAAPAIVRTDA